MHWTIKVDGGPRRVNHAGVVIGEKIYTLGGYCTGEESLYTRPIDVHVLNTTNYRWSLVPCMRYTLACNGSLADIPYQRYGHTAVAYKNNIYLWGGKNDDESCNILYCLNTETHTWSRPKVEGNIPGARDGHSACVIEDSMYVFGGFDEEADRFSQSVYVLDFITMTWRLLPTNRPPPSYRDFHTATAIGNRMYIYGGRGDENGAIQTQEEIYCPEIMYLDLISNEWHMPKTTGNKPIGRRSHSAFVYEDDIYIFGGFNGILNEHFNAIYRFSPRTNHWELMQPHGVPPTPRRRQVCIVVGNRMFMFGGTSPSDNNESCNIESMNKLLDCHDLHVLEFSPTLRTLCLLAVINYNLDTRWLPSELRYEIRSMVTPNNITRQLNSTG